ncbi:MAG: hypothetical protein WC792_03870 [Candidatus Micrarchaeia archaeon]|jgi:hypothetical protein
MHNTLELYLETANAILGLILTFIAYGIYGYFRKTSLASPLRIIGWAFFIFILHEALGVAGEAWDADFKAYYDASEIMFGIMMLVGFYEFKKQFEKFEWVQEISATSEILRKK